MGGPHRRQHCADHRRHPRACRSPPREHDPGHATSTPVLPKPRSGAIINRGPLDPLEIAGAKSALDRLAFATKFLSTQTTGEVLIPPYLPARWASSSP